jgi:hypothetical protein
LTPNIKLAFAPCVELHLKTHCSRGSGIQVEQLPSSLDAVRAVSVIQINLLAHRFSEFQSEPQGLKPIETRSIRHD